MNNIDSLLEPEDEVLSTLYKDGRRRWLNPKLSKGKWWHRRRWVAYVLMVIFIAVPFFRINGKPLILLDIAARQFTVFGKTFLPTDTLVLAFLLLSVFISIVLITTFAGRLWCGWACPQTVFMEFLFRPLDRFFAGTSGKGGLSNKTRSGWWQVARILTYVVLAMVLAHTFLAYFIGTDRLARWMQMKPWEHPTAFLVMAAATAAMLYQGLVFREQLCLIACPYGRFQSVMLDEQSLIVAYDQPRGEPRKKGKHFPNEKLGDCVDCHRCVVVCPTGIDIRKGLQMECINCTQCIDACDEVMTRVGLPTGLIRYSSQDSIAGKPRRFLRARTIVYPIILALVLTGFVVSIASKTGFDARLIRGKGSPFVLLPSGELTNPFLMRLVNRTDQRQTYELAMQNDTAVTLAAVDQSELTLDAGQSERVAISLNFPVRLTAGTGSHDCIIVVRDSSQNERHLKITLVGPR